MSEPKGQHLVPRCYLKKFGRRQITTKKAKWFVHVLNTREKEKPIFEANVDVICKQTEFYTFKNWPESEKRFLEKYFADTIESDYPKIYEKLIDDTVRSLSNSERESIIKFVLHQSFRTDRIINNYNEIFTNIMVDKIRTANNEDVGKIMFDNGYEVNFQNRKIEDVLKEEKRNNQERINLFNYYKALELTSFRKDDLISIITVNPEFFLITSDNPVYFFGDMLDSSTTIIMPINSKQLLHIVSKSKVQQGDKSTIIRNVLSNEFSEIFTTFNNIYHIHNCGRLAIGNKSHLERVFKQYSSFGMTEMNVMVGNLKKMKSQRKFL